METTYDVRIWKIDVYRGTRVTTYRVLWAVAGRRWKEPFRTSALAESFRSDLMSAARKGEAFSVLSGRPLSMDRVSADEKWYDHACQFVDLKWPHVAATTRRTHAEAMTAITMLMLKTADGPDPKVIRTALRVWAFNTVKRADPEMPEESRAALAWVKRNSRPVAALAMPETLRGVLNGLTLKLDGEPMATSVVTRRRKIFGTSLEYAVERKLLATNPIPKLKWTAPKSAGSVDRRRVANPRQAATLLDSVRRQGRWGRHMVAFYGCLYYAALRPEEAVALKLSNLTLPSEGWGSMTIESAEPYAGKGWTNSGENRDRRHLKQRDRGETRTVPIPPQLTLLIHEHVKLYGKGTGGRLFWGERNRSELPVGTVHRVWSWARKDAFTAEVAASPLAAVPYDLRHAAVSTWLNGGVPPTQVAEWAGHSVEVLLKIYAKCLDGGEAELQRRVETALGGAAGAQKLGNALGRTWERIGDKR
ncbi:tyrosine-type recombinase/integrase [Kineosporia mesophila]|uniref:Tyrosine-type recombinase/integrase n=1 Tax=Kineosporia mesophila TaxID=566012 RepID=A0ABP6ZW53_9ACTN|nr:tyrosine-type recombinase/integrase [Kineosporia mesophila]MCD5348528.1 tyrosine-type recombinase/integrase [Kineosporia mesophila]